MNLWYECIIMHTVKIYYTLPAEIMALTYRIYLTFSFVFNILALCKMLHPNYHKNQIKHAVVINNSLIENQISVPDFIVMKE